MITTPVEAAMDAVVSLFARRLILPLLGLSLLATACAIQRSATAPGPGSPAPVEAVPPVPGPTDPVDRAVRLYEDARYSEALPLLLALDQEGRATGPLLYRLHYCQIQAADRTSASATLARALERLRQEHSSSPTLEVSFYLVNALSNLGQGGESREMAARTTAAIEGGGSLKPGRPMEFFQVGRLYEQQMNEVKASEWYRKALDGFAAEPGRYTGNIYWARRYLGDLALSRADYVAAERELAAAVGTGRAGALDYTSLAVAQGRQGRWTEAGASWQESVRIDPGNADNWRYAARLAQTASEIGPLPSTDPSGRGWGVLTPKELETVMTEQIAKARQTREKGLAIPVADAAARESILDAIRDVRRVFVAAALEYALRRSPIREIAFTQGYAPMIFQDENWILPEPEASPPEGEPPAAD